MDHDEALAALERRPYAAASERLRAARFLAQNATRRHRARLLAVRSVEHNSWVRQALDHALRHLGTNASSEASGSVPDVHEPVPEEPRLHQEILAEATAETAAFFLHELRPLVGLVEMDASQEMSGYAESRTRKSIDRVRAFLSAIERLRVASAPPATREFDLTDMVTQAAQDEVERGRATLDIPLAAAEQNPREHQPTSGRAKGSRVELALARHDPIVTLGDPALVEMALVNALRNAVEAVLELPAYRRGQVILNWGVTDTDNWVVVLDEGAGLPEGFDRLAEPGVSTKRKASNHVGMGLPIAQRAIDSLGGTFRLTPRSGGGVSCEIRWPRGDVEE